MSYIRPLPAVSVPLAVEGDGGGGGRAARSAQEEDARPEGLLRGHEPAFARKHPTGDDEAPVDPRHGPPGRALDVHGPSERARLARVGEGQPRRPRAGERRVARLDRALRRRPLRHAEGERVQSARREARRVVVERIEPQRGDARFEVGSVDAVEGRLDRKSVV